MSPLVPDDVTRALLDLGLRPTGTLGPSGGWLASDAAGGLVELVVRHGTPDGATAAALTALRHDHVVPVRAVLPLDGGQTSGLLVGTGPTVCLDAVRRARVPLTEGEAATVVIPLAEALTALHAAGLAYGPLGPADVLLTSEGMPVLAAPTRPFGPADDDVRALLTAVLGAMAPRTVALSTGGHWAAGPELRDVLEGLVSAGCRSADEVVRACLEAVRPEPIRLPAAVTERAGQASDRRTTAAPRAGGPGPRPGSSDAVAGSRVSARLARLRVPTLVAAEPEAPPRAGRQDELGRAAARRAARRRHRTGSAVVAAVTLGVALAVLLRPAGPAQAGVAPGQVGVAAAVGVAPGVDGTGTLAAHPEPVADRADPAGAAAALTRLRATALGSGDAAELDAVDVAGGPARTDDGRLVASLDGAAVEGLGADVQDVRVLAGTPNHEPTEVTVEVTAAMTPYTLVGADGARTAVPGTVPRPATLTLRWTEDGWRVWSVSDGT